MPPRIKYFPLLVPISPGLSRLLFSPMLNNCRGCRVDSLQNRMVGDCRRAVRALRAEDSQTATPATAFRLAAVTRGPEGTFRLQPSMQAARLGPKPHSRSNHDFLEQNRRLGCVSMAVGGRATEAASTPENRRAQDVLQVLWLSMLERQCKELDSFDASLSGSRFNEMQETLASHESTELGTMASSPALEGGRGGRGGVVKRPWHAAAKNPCTDAVMNPGRADRSHCAAGDEDRGWC